MRAPQIPYKIQKVRREVVAMGGFNRSDRLKDGDIAESRNVSLRRWPYLSTRLGRKEQAGYDGCTALSAWNKLVAVNGTDLLYDGKVVGKVTEGEKQFAVLNTKLVIWPDRVYFDLQNNKLVSMGATLTAAANTATFTATTLSITDEALCYEHEEDDYNAYRLADETGMTWFSRLYVFKITGTPIWNEADGWSKTSYQRVELQSVHTGDKIMIRDGTSDERIMAIIYETGDPMPTFNQEGKYGVITGFSDDSVFYAPGYGRSLVKASMDIYKHVNNGSFTDGFKAGDTVTITGAGVNNREAVTIEAVAAKKLTFPAGTGFTPATNTSLQVSVSRGIPSMDFICESDNRLWGCSSESQTIYASALGDPTNFYTVEGLATDSYAVPVGSEGNFTGCCKLGSSILFWKEHKLHKVLGSYPAEYAVYSYDIEGVKEGCGKSMQIIDEVLYYMGTQGVCAYAGGAPGLISACFGREEFGSAVAGNDGGRYYLSAKDRKGNWHLLVYDISLGLWVQEDNIRCMDFARLGRKLYFAGEDGKVYQVDGEEDTPELEWMVQFTPFYETIEGRKSFSKILIRTELAKGSWIKAEARFDRGLWQECGKVVGKKAGVTPLRLAINRCDRFEIRLRGKGPCTVLSMLREFSVGSEK